MGLGLNVVYGEFIKEFVRGGFDFFCFCGFLVFLVIVFGFCIRLIFNYFEVDLLVCRLIKVKVYLGLGSVY